MNQMTNTFIETFCWIWSDCCYLCTIRFKVDPVYISIFVYQFTEFCWLFRIIQNFIYFFAFIWDSCKALQTIDKILTILTTPRNIPSYKAWIPGLDRPIFSNKLISCGLTFLNSRNLQRKSLSTIFNKFTSFYLTP